MGRFQNAAAVVVVSLLLLLACDAAGLGDASSSSPPVKQQRPPAARVGETVFVGPSCEDEVNLSQVDEGQLGHPRLEPGFRTFQVQITNTSIDRKLYNIRVSCGGFGDDGAYYLHIQDEFNRISDSECVVKHGGELLPGDSIEFEYASKTEYPFAVTSASC